MLSLTLINIYELSRIFLKKRALHVKHALNPYKDNVKQHMLIYLFMKF